MNKALSCRFGIFFAAFACLLFCAPFSALYPQSGKPKPAQTNEEAPRSNVDADKYKFVFVAGWDGKLLSRGFDEAARFRHSRLDDFTAHLNRLGAQGYRLD